MADIHIHREHRLGLGRARKIAAEWAEAAEAKFSMECTIIEGRTSDVVEFRRPGVEGRLVVDADAFALDASLGLLLGAFRGRIEQEIEAYVDTLLAAAAAAAKTKGKAAAKPAAKKARK